LSVLQLLFWEILKFSLTFHCLTQLNRATLKRQARSRALAAMSARFSIPNPTRVLSAVRRRHGTGMRAGALSHTGPSDPAPQGGPRGRATAAAPRRRRRAARAPCSRCMHASWPPGGPRRGAPTLYVCHTPSSLAFALAQLRAFPLRCRRHRPKLAGAPHLPPPSSSPSTTIAPTHTPWTLLRTCIGWPTRLLAGIATAAADRHPPCCRPSPEPSPLLTVNSCIKVRLDLQADKSPVVVKGPFFPRVVNPRYRIRGTNM
jgi:hypothetical protein